jgi:hypothetical protein
LPPLLLPLPCSIDGNNAGSNQQQYTLTKVTDNATKGSRRIQVRCSTCAPALCGSFYAKAWDREGSCLVKV